MEQWQGFKGKKWQEEIDVRDFIQQNYTLYEGDDSFLAGPTQATKDLWAQVMDLNKQEREAGGVLDTDSSIVSTMKYRISETDDDIQRSFSTSTIISEFIQEARYSFFVIPSSSILCLSYIIAIAVACAIFTQIAKHSTSDRFITIRDLVVPLIWFASSFVYTQTIFALLLAAK